MVKNDPTPSNGRKVKGRKGFKTLMPPAATNKIRQWRLFRKIVTQGELAQKAGLTRATLSRLESGAMRYHQDQLEALSRVLDCTTFDLIGTDPFAEPDIFKIYRRLSTAKKRAAEKAIKSLT